MASLVLVPLGSVSAQEATDPVLPGEVEQSGQAIATFAELLKSYGAGKLESSRDANGNISPEVLLEIGRLASGLDMDSANQLANTAGQLPEDQVFEAVPDLAQLTDVTNAQTDGSLDSMLRTAYEGLDKMYKDPKVPQEEKAQIYEYLTGLHGVLSKQPGFSAVTKVLDGFVAKQLENAGLGNFAESMKELMSGDIKDAADLAARITKINPDALAKVMNKIGTTAEGLGKYLPKGVTIGDFSKMLEAYKNGGMDGLMKNLGDKLGELAKNNPALQKAKQELDSWIDKAFGKLSGTVKGLIEGVFKKAVKNIGRIFKKPKFPLKNLGDVISALGTVALIPQDPVIMKAKAKEIGGLLMAPNVDEAEWEIKAIKNVTRENMYEAFPDLNASEIAALKMRIEDKKLLDNLVIVRDELESKFRLFSYAKVARILRNYALWHYTANHLHGLIKEELAELKFGETIGGLSELLDAQKSGALANGQTDLEALAAKLGDADLTPLIEKMRKLGNPALTELASYLPETVTINNLQAVMDGFAKGTLNKAMQTLKGELTKLVGKVLPERLPNLTALKDKVSKFADSLKGKIGDKVGGVLKGSGLGDLLGGLGKGGFTGVASKINLKDLGLDKINVPGAGNLGDLLGQAASSGGGTLGDVINSGAMDSLSGIIGNLIGGGGFSICPRKNANREYIDSASTDGNTRKVSGIGDHDEIPDCPQVNCDKDSKTVASVKEYFEYKPPQSNLVTLMDKSQHDYEVNYGRRFAEDSKQRPPGYIMKDVDCKTRTNNKDVNGPCQDNRWRDTCLTGQAPKDEEFNLYSRALNSKEEPWPGLAGSVPLLDADDTKKVNCMINKNTERRSPLTFDNGWRYRSMCTGDNQLGFRPNDGIEARISLFGELDEKGDDYNCKRIISKCAFRKDWDIDNTRWVDAVYGVYKKASSGKGSLATVFERMTSEDQQKALEKMTDTSTSPECKPAFWVRLMADSCANQYISRLASNPNLVYQPDQERKRGLSPRFCQPMRMDTNFIIEDEYDVTDYLKRAAQGVLSKDYLPWVDRGNPWKGPEAAELYKEWMEKKNKKVSRKIQNSGKLSEATVAGLYQQKRSIKDYASQPVERILDPTHPYSPRYDVALFKDGSPITDRTLFEKATETPMFPNPMLMFNTEGGADVKGLRCVQSKRSGYFEYGKCTVYCSAVDVDVMRFRYEDLRLGMGCQIDANSYAFWEEQRINRDAYFAKRCFTQFDSTTTLPEKSDDDECTYGDKICGSCTNAAINCTACAISGTNCDTCGEDALHCVQCGMHATYEATDRARKRINKKQEPEYGPSKTKTDGKNWPICSTRYDYDGDKELCKQAKEDSGGCEAQGEAAKEDPNIGEDRTAIAASYVDKTVEQICHDAAKPVYSVNFMKIRPVKQNFASADPDWSYVRNMDSALMDQDPPKTYQFRTYFQNRRPYMRWWDTGREAFQGEAVIEGTAEPKPDYSCDLGANDTYFGVGRDFNSIHGRPAQICAYVGGDGVGDNCFKMKDWRDGEYPELAGTEWAELKMYQMNCFRNAGLNCLCQYEKIFKPEGTEDAALAAVGTTFETFSKVGGRENRCFSAKPESCHEQVPASARKEANCPSVVKDQPSLDKDNYIKFLEMSADGKSAIVEVQVPCMHNLPLGWRGYVSTPTDYGRAEVEHTGTSGNGKKGLGNLIGNLLNGQPLKDAAKGLADQAAEKVKDTAKKAVLKTFFKKSLNDLIAKALKISPADLASKDVEKVKAAIDRAKSLSVGDLIDGTLEDAVKLVAGDILSYNLDNLLMDLGINLTDVLTKAEDVTIGDIIGILTKKNNIGAAGVSSSSQSEGFPYLYGTGNGTIITGGLDRAQENDILIWPTQKGTLPRMAWVLVAKTDATIPGGIKNSPEASMPRYRGKYRGYVSIMEKNNGMLPDVCGNTSELNKGGQRTLYANVESLPEDVQTRLREQVTATYYCENPFLKECVDRQWNDIIIFRPSAAERDDPV